MSTETNGARGALVVDGVAKEYTSGEQQIRVLDEVSLGIEAGGAVCLTGPSGSGKSTLLHIVGALEPPTRGTVTLDGEDPYRLDEPSLAAFRNRKVGFVFQDHHLLPQFDLLQNVLLPALADGAPREGRGDLEHRASELLAAVGLNDRLRHRPAQLSGGERQRGAIARALMNRPSLLLCDEPTGNLDHRNAEAVADLLFELQRRERTSLLVVTHSLDLAARFEARLRLEDGRCLPA